MAKNKKKNSEKIDYKYNLSEYWSFLKKYKLLFGTILIISFLSEAGGVVDKFLFKIIIDKGNEFLAGTLLRNLFVEILIYIAVAFLVIKLAKNIFDWLYIHFVNRLSVNLMTDLKRKYFNHIVSLSHSFHTTHKTGSLISKLTRSGGAIERMTDVLVFNVAPLVFNLIIVLGSLIYFSVKPAMVVVVICMVFILYSVFIQKIQKKYSVLANEAEDKEKAGISDVFTNIDSVKYFGKDSLIKRNFRRVTEFTKNAIIKDYDFFRWQDAGQTLILAIGAFFLVYFPLMDFLDSKITIGTLVFIYTIYGNIFWPLFSFVHGIKNYYRAMADFNGLFEYGKIDNEIKDSSEAKDLKINEGTVEFDSVDFGYHKRKIIKNFNLKIPMNKKIALVGHSGCGKTTLIKLLYRFYDVNSGGIKIDGKDIRNVKKESLRGEMSIVPQECILFDDTIYRNVSFSNPSATRKEVIQAMKFAQLDKIVKSFPDGLNTIVGERGVKLSGGEKQRVSIARAILANKKVLVLDEATSSLDSQTEYEIQKDLEKLMQGRTSIIIAHRLSTIMKADKIIVMDNGKIVQQGTHKQLISRPGQYRKLWDLQKGGY
ncbi:MAG: ABC transporter ATP-binding protein/permease, partial [Nanoarchaeota archaeon]|nr:ABC transporter ATP-binding protein/permease [Nanoarchaeota archaeon]